MEKYQKNEILTQDQKSNKVDDSLKLFLNCLPKKLSKGDIIHYFNKFYGVDGKFDLDISFKKNLKTISGVLTCPNVKTKFQILEKKTHTIGVFILNPRPHLTKEQLGKLIDVTKEKKIFIERLPECFDNEKLKLIFEVYGEVEKVFCVSGRKKKRKKGFQSGYVVFKDKNSKKKLPVKGIPFGKGLIKWENCVGKKSKEVLSHTKKFQNGLSSQAGEIKGRNMLRSVKESLNKRKEEEEPQEEFIWKSDKFHFLKPGEVFYHQLNLSISTQSQRSDVRFNLAGTSFDDY